MTTELDVLIKGRVALFACGDPSRGDDAVARAAVYWLPPHARLAADIRLVSQLEPEHLAALPPGQPVIIIDAVVGIDPGRLVCIDLADLPERAERMSPRSSHQLPLDQVVGLGQILGGEHPGVFIGVGTCSFGLGEALSPPVRSALPALRAAIAAEVERLAPADPTDAAVMLDGNGALANAPYGRWR